MWPLWNDPSMPTSDPSAQQSRPEAPTARQARGTRRDEVRSTSDEHLQPPIGPRGLPLRRGVSPQARLRELASRRSPSPSPTSTANHFAFPTPTTMDEETVQRIVAESVKKALERDREEHDRQSSLVTQAAVRAALENQTAQVQALRKPDLPSLDRDNIESWIKRVENAYVLSNVTNSKCKFAYIERLFLTKEDKKINRFLWGSQTDAEWTAFLAYL